MPQIANQHLRTKPPVAGNDSLAAPILKLAGI